MPVYTVEQLPDLIDLCPAAIILKIQYLPFSIVSVDSMRTLLPLKYKPKRLRELAQVGESEA